MKKHTNLHNQQNKQIDKKVLTIFKNLFDANIFRNRFDAVFGGIVLFLIPLTSLILARNSLILLDAANFGFPIMAICLAGIYDAYGKWGEDTDKNITYKRSLLIFRIVIDFLVIALVWLGIGFSCVPIILWALRGFTISGLGIVCVNVLTMIIGGKQEK